MPIENEKMENQHTRVWELLPWYVNGTLSASESETVQAHLADCPQCQREVARCARLATTVKSSGQDVWAPTPKHLSAVWARIDEATRADERATNATGLLARLRGWLSASPQPMRWALAVQGALVLALASAVVLREAPGPAAQYGTLSNAQPRPAGQHTTLRMVFADDLTQKELRELLQRIGAAIADGPSPTGVYTIELPRATPGSTQMRQLVADLRAQTDKVKFVEVVSPEPSE